MTIATTEKHQEHKSIEEYSALADFGNSTTYKICKRCGEQKELCHENFPWAKSEKEPSTLCRKCVNESYRGWRRRTPELTKARNRRRYLKDGDSIRAQSREYKKNNLKRSRASERKGHMLARFGMTIEEYDLLFESQNKVCAICGVNRTTKRVKNLPVDHDHANGNNRGILCPNCNLGLGLFDDNIEVMGLAIQYLLASPNSLNLRYKVRSSEKNRILAILKKINSSCQICANPCLSKSYHEDYLNFPCVDHDHSTGLVRGLLCGRHNSAIGKFRDNPELIRKAIGYLKYWKTKHLENS